MSPLILSWLLLAAGGCANLRLPAIDPSGQNLLLPPPSYTTLNKHHQDRAQAADAALSAGSPSQGSCCFSRPAFEDPPKVPPCEDPPLVPNAPSGPPLPDCVPQEVYTPVAPRVVVAGACQQDPEGQIYTGCSQSKLRDYHQTVKLTPRRQIAAVGSEVILIGGVCDEEGYYRLREPMEWTLSQQSVGHFTDPGDPAVGWLGRRGHLASLGAEPLPELCSNNYAVSLSSKKVQVLTRGTKEPNDDLFVLEGQGWISLTSPIEGNTYVTLSAPELDGWQQRQEMAVIHWIDGQWTLPPPVVARGLQPQVLTTTVCRRLTGSPVAGWIVRYEIVGGVPTTLEGGASAQEVMTDSTGKASVRVLPPSTQGGVTQVRVQVIRPGGLEGAPDRLMVGDGTTTITWSSAQLQVRLLGPESLELNQTANYQIEVTNTGNVAVTNVQIRATAPFGFAPTASTPQGQISGSQVAWMLAQLDPGQQQLLQVSYRITQSGTARICVSAAAAGAAAVENCLTAQVTADALYIEMLGPNPEVPLPVGQTANYQVTVTNRGDRRLADVLLVDRFDAGLQHREGTSPVEWPLGALEPGQSHQVGLSFLIVAPGRHCHTLEATADGTRPARTTACVTAQAPRRSELTVRKTGPAQMIVGQQDNFQVTVENTGEVPLSNLQIIDSYDPELRPIAADPPEQSIDQGRVVWYVSQLAPGQRLTFQVTCQALFDVNSTCSRVIVRTAGGLERTDELCLPVLQPSTGGSSPTGSTLPPRLLPGRLQERDHTAPTLPLPTAFRPSSQTREGLDLTIDGHGDRWQVGDRIDYLIVIHNADGQADSDVALNVELSPSLKLEGSTGPVSAATNSPDRRRLSMIPLRTLRAGETVKFNIVATVSEPGELVARADLTSLHLPQGITQKDVSWATP